MTILGSTMDQNGIFCKVESIIANGMDKSTKFVASETNALENKVIMANGIDVTQNIQIQSQLEIQNNMEREGVKVFYRGKNILITGATGFLGKVLLWKLLESCPDSGKIYVLLRSKQDINADKRLMKMLKSAPFVPKFNYDLQLKNKIIAIDSDITEKKLGLTQQDRNILISNINIVFHCAASVKFDAPLKDNMRDNVIGTQGIIELCREIEKLNSFIHVSTAYCNCHLNELNEDLHELDNNPDDIMKLTQTLSTKACDKITKDIIEQRPNTYTYTKAIAEHLVAREQDKMPVGIVRPSIVTSSAAEPSPGWVDNVNGLVGLGILASLGILRTIDWNYWAISDMVPVDYVASCIIVAGQSTAKEYKTAKAANTKQNAENSDKIKNTSGKLKFYNMTSGNVNPISWGSFFDLLRTESMRAPTSKAVRPVITTPQHVRANPTKYLLTRIFSELLFAYIVDTLIALFGYKRLMVRITKKMHNAYEILSPFTIREWTFESKNVIELSESLSPEDREEFKFDMRSLSWKIYAHDFWLGARYFILKEENSNQSFANARLRYKFVLLVHYFIISIIVFAPIYLSYSCISKALRV